MRWTRLLFTSLRNSWAPRLEAGNGKKCGAANCKAQHGQSACCQPKAVASVKPNVEMCEDRSLPGQTWSVLEGAILGSLATPLALAITRPVNSEVAVAPAGRQAPERGPTPARSAAQLSNRPASVSPDDEPGQDLRHLSFGTTVSHARIATDVEGALANPLDAAISASASRDEAASLSASSGPAPTASGGGTGSSAAVAGPEIALPSFSIGFGSETTPEHSLNSQLAQAPAAGYSANQAMVAGEGSRTSKPGLPIDPPVTPPVGPPTPVKPPPAPRAEPVEGSRIVVTGPDAGHNPLVKVFNADTQELRFSFNAYSTAHQGGVRVAVGDVNNDGWDDIITGTGTNLAHIRVFDGETGERFAGTAGNFHAFLPQNSHGVHVAAGDVNNDGYADIIVGTGEGSTPRVKVFSGLNRSLLADFLVTGMAPIGGVRVASADFNEDGYAEIVTAAGPGWNSRVSVWDGWNGARTADFFAFDDLDESGVYVATGDVSGDGIADLIVSSGAANGGAVRAYNGTSLGHLDSRIPFGEEYTGGVRMAMLDGNDDGYLDWLAATGPGDGDLNVLDGKTGAALAEFHPYGQNFDKGFFIAASPAVEEGGESAERGVRTTPTLSLSVVGLQDNFEGSGETTTVRVTRSGNTSGYLAFGFTMSGTATQSGGSADLIRNFFLETDFQDEVTTFDILINWTNDTRFEGLETAVITLTPDVAYNIDVGTIVTSLADNDGPQPSPAAAAACGPCERVDVIKPTLGVGHNGPVSTIEGPVRVHDGAVGYVASDLMAAGFGSDWGVTRTWTNAPGYDALATEGNGFFNKYVPMVIKDSTGVVAAITGCTVAHIFDVSGSDFVSRHGQKETMVYDDTLDEYVLTDTTGNVLKFYDFDAGLPAAQKGQFKSLTDPYGNVTSITSRNGDGKPTEIQRTTTAGGTTITESYLLTYYTSGDNTGLISNITLRRQVGGGGWTTIRQVDYTYYGSSESHGNLNDLKTAIIKDGSGNALDTWYYRWYKSGDSNGYVGGLKYAFSPESFARADAAVADPLTASNGDIDDFADLYFEYDATKRVTKAVVQGAGCSACSAGLGEYTFSYTTSSFANGYNNWLRKTTIGLPDGNQRIVYTNFVGQVLLDITKDVTSGDEWKTGYLYDDNGRLLTMAHPSAVSGYDATKADLFDNVSGNFTHLRDSTGLVETFSYYTSTTAGSSTAGGVAGYFYQHHLKKGETGTGILQSTLDYISRTANSITIYPVANSTVYRETNGTGGQTTNYAYTWFSSTLRPESITVTKQTVTTAQNGPNSADVEVTYFDLYMRPIWFKDGEGFLHYTEYDQATGAVKKSIRDVDSSITADFSNKPSGWTTPGTGGQHLKTTMDIDGLGRSTKVTDPVGNATYIVYKDTSYEVRTYAGWNTTTDAPTGPTIVQRYDRPGSYIESLTMSATPALNGSDLPTGTESIASIQSLSRQYLNNAGQMTRRDDYHSLSGVTYSTSQFIGTVNTHYYTTLVDYTHRGWQNRVVSPTGTINRTVYDVLGRVVSTWVGTNDTPASGFWSPTNNTSPSNMVKVSEYEYDGGGIGDSNLTKLTQIPGGGATNRVTQMFYDWRNRQVATKQGVEGSESTSLNRAIFYTEFDNLSQAIAQEQYDGDNISITDGNSDGVPDKPSSSLLRARTVTSFDEQGRVYRTQVYSVNQSNGTVSSDALTTNMWFDRRGLVLKTSQPGGLVTKSLFDGAGRTLKSYSTDGGGDSGYSDADDVTGDKVLEQVEYAYDDNGNVELVTTRLRFHDETGTGELGTVSTGNAARVSYVAMYYDKANRLTDTVNEGTNGASAYTRPGSVPSRTDTELVTSNTYNDAGWVSIVTDPRGIELRTYFDLLGRRTKTIEAYVDGTPSNTDDKTTEFTYDGSGHLLTLKALLTGSDYQETKWVYGVTTGSGSGITSNDVLAELWYPNKSTGAASSSEKEIYTVNALGESLTKQDRNGNIHTFSYDVVGRMTTDAVTTLGSGVNGAVRRLETAYDTGGRAYLFTSYDASSSGNVVNQVQRDYNGLGQLITEYQAHSGAVNTGSTPNVQYAYSEMASSANHSRLIGMTYPNGRSLTYRYTGLDSSVSRYTDIRDGNDTLEAYNYLGLGTVIRRAQSQAGVELTYIKQGAEGDGEAGDKYAGLDRFGRIIDQRWMKTSDASNRDRFQYGYDRNSNRLYEKNLVDGAFSELYHANGASNGYDKLNQISEFRRGTLSDANSDGVPDTVTTASRSQVWTLDPLGNWSTVNNDGTAQNRTHNRQNQITSISSLTTPTYDANGNMTGDENGKTLVYDAWNRLVDFKNGGTSLEAYAHDALNRRVTENPGTARALFYTAEWQVIEERTSGVARVSNVWSPVYIDALIVRDRDSDTNGSMDERLYVAHDANWNVSSILNTSAAVQERYVYDAFGTPSYKDASFGARGGSSFGWTALHQGGRQSAASSLIHFHNRDVSPSLGYLLREDPLRALRPRHAVKQPGPKPGQAKVKLCCSAAVTRPFGHYGICFACNGATKCYDGNARFATSECMKDVAFLRKCKAWNFNYTALPIQIRFRVLPWTDITMPGIGAIGDNRRDCIEISLSKDCTTIEGCIKGVSDRLDKCCFAYDASNKISFNSNSAFYWAYKSCMAGLPSDDPDQEKKIKEWQERCNARYPSMPGYPPFPSKPIDDPGQFPECMKQPK